MGKYALFFVANYYVIKRHYAPKSSPKKIKYHRKTKPVIINHNIKFLSATEFNAETIEGDYLRNIMMCNAEYELALIRFRTKENMKTIAKNGRKPSKAPI